MYDLPPRRRISLILVKLGPAHKSLEVKEYLVKAKGGRRTDGEVDALGVITISRGCFERCCSNKKTPPYHSNL